MQVVKLAVLFLTAFLGRCQAQQRENSSSPWFCHDLDCPPFVTLDKNADYETRQYTPANWVSVNVQNYTYSAAVSKGFAPLFGYISGANKEGVRINMTAPVLVKVLPGDGPFCQNNFTISFFVPTQQGDTPVPTEPSVYLSRLPAATYFVSSFGGFADDTSVPAQAAALTAKLTANGEAFDSSAFWTAGYDAPYKLTGRHNEIWILKSDAAGRSGSTPAKSVAG
ncbi:probable heme-binding protein 1 [Coccomyxa sp. Obi]|nr:probable heme-binding protein 1 [Coccomyxa sp. Obi]BDA45189.1 probable heme-binding protein 1 [Coccomyxa sp. Obi]